MIRKLLLSISTIALSVAVFASTASASDRGPGATEEELERATEITRVFIIIGLVMIAIGYGIWLVRRGKANKDAS